MVGENMQLLAQDTTTWDPQVTMWVHEELVNGRKLTEIINEEHENPK